MEAVAPADGDDVPPVKRRLPVTGCGCALVVGMIGALLYALIRGSSDEGEPVDAF